MSTNFYENVHYVYALPTTFIRNCEYYYVYAPPTNFFRNCGYPQHAGLNDKN